MDLSTIIGLGAGIIGGNGAGKVVSSLNQVVVVNSIAGLVGGGIGAQVLGMVAPALAGGGMDIQGIIGQVIGGGVGGGALLAIFGAVKGAMGK